MSGRRTVSFNLWLLIWIRFFCYFLLRETLLFGIITFFYTVGNIFTTSIKFETYTQFQIVLTGRSKTICRLPPVFVLPTTCSQLVFPRSLYGRVSNYPRFSFHGKNQSVVCVFLKENEKKSGKISFGLEKVFSENTPRRKKEGFLPSVSQLAWQTGHIASKNRARVFPVFFFLKQFLCSIFL